LLQLRALNKAPGLKWCNRKDLNLLPKVYYLVRVIPKLGFWNFFYVVWYRLSIRFGWRKYSFPTEIAITGEFYQCAVVVKDFPFLSAHKTIKKADEIVKGVYTYFHFHKHHIGNPPNWFLNPFNGKAVNSPSIHWTLINDFNLAVGDIKTIWEPSRFDWLTDLARAYRLTGDGQYLDQINLLLNSWSVSNPLNIGPNWKCGQEASFRVMKLITTAQLLNQFERPTMQLTKLVHQHLERIYPNINYAIAQDNNHATSEASALYIGSTWLLKYGNISSSDFSRLNKWKINGRKILEERVMKLVGTDGSFSQQSVNYHRVVMDTMSWVISTMKELGENDFDSQVSARLEALGLWLYQFVQNDSGAVPNMGANDGAMIENLHNCDYRDFRPSLQLYFSLINGHFIFPQGDYDEPAFWRLGYSYNQIERKNVDKPNALLLDKQYAILRNKDIDIYIKVPNGEFRPMNNPFHLDLWYNGKNIVIGSGSYSYNAGIKTKQYKSIASSNTIQFGNSEPMPMLTNFLNGEWIKAGQLDLNESKDGVITFTGLYEDYRKNRHTRTVVLNGKKVEVIDKVVTSSNVKAHWHFDVPLMNDTDNGRVLHFENFSLSIFDTHSIKKEIGNHSLYYMHEMNHTHLFTELEGDTITTIFEFK
jgi:hypothetical protein